MTVQSEIKAPSHPSPETLSNSSPPGAVALYLRAPIYISAQPASTLALAVLPCGTPTGHSGCEPCVALHVRVPVQQRDDGACAAELGHITHIAAAHGRSPPDLLRD